MGIFSAIAGIGKRRREKMESDAKQKAYAEAENIIEYLLDEVGWENVTGDTVSSKRSKRTAKSVEAWTNRNVNKYMDDGYIHRGISLHTDFVFGRGIDIPKCKSDEIQEKVISPMWWSSVNQRNFFSFQAQQRRHKETMLSGELNILIKIDEVSNIVKLYPINPSDIAEVVPDDEEPGRAAYYLIKRKRRQWDFQRNEWSNATKEERTLHRAFRYKLYEATPDEMRRGIVYHAGLNEFYDMLRGSSLIQSIYDPLDEARAMADDGAALSHANAETGWKTKMLKGGKTIKDRFLEYFRTKTDGSNPARAAASEWFENEAMSRNWETARDTGAQHRKEDIRAQKMYGFAGMGFGEHYFGDASTGNLATATSMELPVIKMVQAEQRWWESIYSELIDFAIDVAAVGGIISGKIKESEDIEIETDENRTFSMNFPPIMMKQIDTYLNALNSALNAGLIPDREAARLAMEVFEVQEIDEALEELFDRRDIDKEFERLSSQVQMQPEKIEKAGDETDKDNIVDELAIGNSAEAIVEILERHGLKIPARPIVKQGSNGNGNGKRHAKVLQ